MNTFTRIVRHAYPFLIISHAPQAPYFKKGHYPNGGYLTVDREVGHMIDFYNVQFYNQVDTKYDSYEELFIHATGFFSNTAVNEIIGYGIPSKKIVVGKPATPADASNTGWVEI